MFILNFGRIKEKTGVGTWGWKLDLFLGWDKDKTMGLYTFWATN